VSRLAVLPREAAQPATPAPPVRADLRPCKPPAWRPPPRLTPELIAAYKRKGDRLRAQAFAAALKRVARWLTRGRES
jgi:hypothetical protein